MAGGGGHRFETKIYIWKEREGRESRRVGVDGGGWMEGGEEAEKKRGEEGRKTEREEVGQQELSFSSLSLPPQEP